MGKRVRRRAADIDNLLLNAAKELIEEVGFPNTTVTAVAQKAGVEIMSFYNRFEDITDLFDKYVRAYDYWMNDLFNFSAVKNSSKQNCTNLLIGLIDSLEKDVSMQRILAWEISEDNSITRRTARSRETHSESLIEYFMKSYSDDIIDIRVVSSVLIAGIYYLCLHKNISTFCGINFATKEGVDLLKKNITELVNRIYLKNEVKNPSSNSPSCKESARRLFDDGVDPKIIMRALGLSSKQLNVILGLDYSESDNDEMPGGEENTYKRKRGRPKQEKKWS